MASRPKRDGIMLAYPLDEGRLERLGPSFLIQPKINGERCIVEWIGDEPYFISSYGNEFKYLDHLKAALKELYKKCGPVPLDGEIYVHGWPRERIDSALRRKVNRNPDVEGLEYHIFDVRSGEMPVVRHSFIYQLFDEKLIGQDNSPIHPVTTLISDKDSWLEAASKFVDVGYEGVILRAFDLAWEPKRSVKMLKFKPTEEDEYEILEAIEAIDQHGVPKNMVGSFYVRSLDSGDSFRVGAGKIPHDKRIEYWRIRHSLVGRKLRVKHEPSVTSGGVPLCSVAVDLS